jgi:hypothetical protein
MRTNRLNLQLRTAAWRPTEVSKEGFEQKLAKEAKAEDSQTLRRKQTQRRTGRRLRKTAGLAHVQASQEVTGKQRSPQSLSRRTPTLFSLLTSVRIPLCPALVGVLF